MSDKVTTVVVGLPWYDGPNADTYVKYFDFFMYLGALAERTIIRHAMGAEAFHELSLPPLSTQDHDPLSEPTFEDYERLGRLRIAIIDYSRTSLVGKAREALADSAVNIGADYLLWWDADMQFPYSAFLRCFRHDKPIVGALAFTARDPIFPVLFGVKYSKKADSSGTMYEQSLPLFNYPRGKLIGDEDIDGWLAIGGGFTLIDCGVFSEIPKPWFHSTGVGEDWFFCARAAEYGIGRYCDTTIVAKHKAHKARWYDEEMYWENRRANPDDYEAQWGKLVMPEDSHG
jgi:hypothetical protein